MVTSFFMLQTLGRWAARVVHARYARNVKLVTLAVAGVSGPHAADGILRLYSPLQPFFDKTWRPARSRRSPSCTTAASGTHKTFTREEMLDRLGRPHVAPFIIEAEERPVGYLQAWFDRESEGAGLDMFLIPSIRGRGLGPDAARTLARSLFAAGQRRLTVDPYLWNEAVIRAWKKAGFRPVEEREPDEEHTGRWLLMTFDAASAM
jgi:RimJ/RimL family protein N-acetyltransferase